MSWWCSCFKKTYEAPEITELNYRHFSLKEVPTEVFSNERTLEKLDLGSNQISDLPPSLFHCHELKELDLCDNELVSIPAAVGSLTRLYKLDLSRNAIAEIADTIKNCKSLIYLDLSLNQIQKIPDAISQLVNLEELFLNDTFLEFAPATIGRLTKLRILELRENSIQTLPKSMNRLTNLQRLDIGQNDLFELPEVLGTMINLTDLWCDNNSIRAIPKFIGNLTKLNCLDVSQNEINDIADEISNCILLSDLTLASNNISSLPDSFCKLESLTVLRLDTNSLEYLPKDFGDLKNLQELSLIRNMMKTLPHSIGLLKRLHTLYLDDNLLTEIPKEIGNCTALSVLSLSKNRLVQIPSEMSQLCNLKVLSLASNLLSHLPLSFLNLKLGALWLAESQSKPLLQLNKEIDPETKKEVLTCYLLPQLPPNEIKGYNDENDEVVVRERSKPTIKFLSDEATIPVDNSINNKRGLLRAPTPYPKELRALAKHASHIRQSREINGINAINTDEPEYEGDYGEESEMDERKKDKEPKKLKPAISYTDPGRRIETISVSSTIHTDASELNVKNEISGLNNNENVRRKDEKDEMVMNELNLNRTSVDSAKGFGDSSSEMARKTPPPYHIAAQRAAFFRQQYQPPPSSPSPSNVLSGLNHIVQSSTIGTTESPSSSPLPRSVPSISSVHSYSSEDPPVPPPSNDFNYTPTSISTPTTLESSIDLEPVNNANDRIAKNEEEIIQSPSRSSEENSLNQTFTLSYSRDSKIEEFSASITKMREEIQQRIDNARSLNSGDSTIEHMVNDSERVGNVDQGEMKIGDSERRSEDLTEHSTVPPLPSILHPSFSENHFKSNTNANTKQGIEASQESRIPGLVKSSSSSTVQKPNESKIPVFGVNSYSSIPVSESKQMPQSQVQLPESMSIIGLPSPPENYRIANSSSSSSSIGRPSFTSSSSSALPPPSQTALGSKIPKGSIPSIHTNQNPTNTEDKKLSNSISQPSMAKAKPEIIGPKPQMSKSTSKLLPKGLPHSNTNSTGTIAANTIASSNYDKSRSTQNQLTSSGLSSSKIPRFGSGGKGIPKLVPSSTFPPSERDLPRVPSPSFENPEDGSSLSSYDNSTTGEESSLGSNSVSTSRIPTIRSGSGGKKWIFGTHTNARVLRLDYKKLGDLGFTVSEGFPGRDKHGIYINELENSDSKLKVGDKLIEIDSINVTTTPIEIVRKVLSNCQDTIQLLVSRQSSS